MKKLIIPRRKLILAGAAICAPAVVRAQVNLPLLGIGGGSAVTLQDIGGGTQDNGSSQASFTYTGLTISSGLTRSALVAFITTNTPSGSLTSVTWNGVNLSSVGSITDTFAETQFIYALLSPASGNQNLVVTPSASARIQVLAFSLINVNQTNIATAFPNQQQKADSSGANAFITNNAVTSAASHLVLSGGYLNSGSQFWSSYTNATRITGVAGAWQSVTGQTPGASSVTVTVNWTGSGNIMGIIGTDVAN